MEILMQIWHFLFDGVGAGVAALYASFWILGFALFTRIVFYVFKVFKDRFF